MVLLIDLLQSLLENVSVNLGGGNITVPQHQLNGAQIRAAFEQVSCEGMPESMRMNFFLQSGFFGVTDDYFPETLPGKFPPEAV